MRWSNSEDSNDDDDDDDDVSINPANIDLFKVNNKNTRKMKNVQSW